jgi:hypothetical protein
MSAPGVVATLHVWPPTIPAATLTPYGFDQILQPVIYHYASAHRPWNAGSVPLEAKHRRYFVNGLHAIGASAFLTEVGSRWSLRRRLKFAFSNRLYNTRLFSHPSKRRRYERWLTRYNVMAEYLERALNDGRFADVTQGLSRISVADVRRRAPSLQEALYRRGHIVAPIPSDPAF